MLEVLSAGSPPSHLCVSLSLVEARSMSSGLTSVFKPGAPNPPTTPRPGSPRVSHARPESPRTEAARLQRLEEENYRLRSQVTRLKAGGMYMASSGLSAPGAHSASRRMTPRSASQRAASPRASVPSMEQERLVRISLIAMR